VPLFLKSQNLNLVEPSGPVQGLLYLLPIIKTAVNGTYVFSFILKIIGNVKYTGWVKCREFEGGLNQMT